MFRKPKRTENPYTNSDHRPMIPALRQLNEPLDTAVRDVRRRYDETNPNQYLKWR